MLLGTNWVLVLLCLTWLEISDGLWTIAAHVTFVLWDTLKFWSDLSYDYKIVFHISEIAYTILCLFSHQPFSDPHGRKRKFVVTKDIWQDLGVEELGWEDKLFMTKLFPQTLMMQSYAIGMCRLHIPQSQCDQRQVVARPEPDAVG